MNYIKSIDNDMFIIIILAILGILLIINLILIKKYITLSKRLGIFMSGKSIKSMETIIKRKFKDIEKIAKAQLILDDKVEDLMKSCGGSIQKIGIVKYDADEYMSGKTSFAIAMMDYYNNGFIINSINNGNICYNYLKDIYEGNPRQDVKLSDEEKKAIEYALESIVEYNKER